MRTGRAFAGRFLIEHPVGRGAMGTVYRAIDGDTGATIALKVLDRTDPDAAARFGHEARTLAQLRHPHIVRYLAHGVGGDGAPYLAMEWVDGTTLARLLADRGLSPRETVTIARAIASGLAAAHAAGVVHRDIKPSNLLLEAGDLGRLKIIDFGIARRIDDDVRLTITGHTVGTPGYMAPEQARGWRQLDARADLFALGCVLYECIAGAPAFAGERATALLAKIVLMEPEPLLRRAATTPPALVELVDRLLAKQPDERPGAAMLGELLDSLGDLPDAPRRRAAAVAAPTLVRDGRDLPTDRDVASVVVVDTDRSPREQDLDILQAAEAADARIERTATGWVIAVLCGESSLTAGRGATLALELRRLVPGARIALAVGDGESLGDLLERAAQLIDGFDDGRDDDGVRIDPDTAARLPAGAEVVGGGGPLVLRALAGTG